MVMRKKLVVVVLVLVGLFLSGVFVNGRTRLHCYMKYDGIRAPPEVNIAEGLDPRQNETFPGVTTFVNVVLGDWICLAYFSGQKYCNIVTEIKKKSPMAGWVLKEC